MKRLKRHPRILRPGESIRAELVERAWTQRDLAEVLARPFQIVNQIISGTKRINPDTAVALAAAVGTGAEVWLHLETAYPLARAKVDAAGVAGRAKAKDSQVAEKVMA